MAAGPSIRGLPGCSDRAETLLPSAAACKSVKVRRCVEASQLLAARQAYSFEHGRDDETLSGKQIGRSNSSRIAGIDAEMITTLRVENDLVAELRCEHFRPGARRNNHVIEISQAEFTAQPNSAGFQWLDAEHPFLKKLSAQLKKSSCITFDQSVR